MRMPSAHGRLRVTARTSTARARPKMNECVKPTPGQPRWNRATSLDEYTRYFVNRSGACVPTTTARNETRAPAWCWMK
jgi:hypothetical protein